MHTKIKNNVQHGLSCAVISLTALFNASYAADCTLKLLPTSPVTWVGEFQNFRYTEEHQYGESITLWRSNHCFFGVFISMAQLQGDPPRGLIENAVYEPKTGRLSFNAMLSQGITTPDPINQPNESIPSKHWYTVKGVLTKSAFRGTMNEKWLAYKPDQGTTTKIYLKRYEYSSYEPKRHEDDPYETVTTYKNYGEWLLDFKQYKKYR